MKNEKPIDLGELQNNLTKLQVAAHVAAITVERQAKALLRAQESYDAAVKKRAAATMAVDTHRQAMLEAARTVANSVKT